MKVRANARMRALLGADVEAAVCPISACPDPLVADLQDGFRVETGCFVPKHYNRRIWSASRPFVDNQDDETGLECSLSKVHIDDYLEDEISLRDIARVGIAYAVRLRDALRQSVPSGNFRIPTLNDVRTAVSSDPTFATLLSHVGSLTCEHTAP